MWLCRLSGRLRVQVNGDITKMEQPHFISNERKTDVFATSYVITYTHFIHRVIDFRTSARFHLAAQGYKVND
jgi:hypothetical protein